MMFKQKSKKIIKNFGGSFLCSFGVDKVIQKNSRNKKMIIMYHGISSCNCFRINARHLPFDEFEKHLLYYKRHFDIIGLNEMYAFKGLNYMPKRPTISLTFDDGFINNLTVALPLLEKHKVPATFFVNTLQLENPNTLLWSDILEIGCAIAKSDQVKLSNLTFTRVGRYRWYNENGQGLEDFLNLHPPKEKDRLINEWKIRYNFDEEIKKIDSQCFSLMNESQLKKLAESEWAEIGSHTHSHHILSLLNDEELEFELSHSKYLLEDLTGKKVLSIAFPNGNYDQRVLDFCNRAGYKNLVGVGLNENEDKSITNLAPRMGIANSDGLAFNMLNISRYFDRLGF
jgi:peptidoglycan/xylan/chitin deacetylase (PgdA/CDA1 family)